METAILSGPVFVCFLAGSKTTRQPEKVSWELCVFLVDSVEANIQHTLIAFIFIHVKKGIFVTLMMDGWIQQNTVQDNHCMVHCRR